MPARLLIIASYSGKFYSFPHFYSLALSFTQPLSHVFFLSLACFFFHGIAFKSANKHFFSADMHRSLQHCNKLKHFYHIFILPLTRSLAHTIVSFFPLLFNQSLIFRFLIMLTRVVIVNCLCDCAEFAGSIRELSKFWSHWKCTRKCLKLLQRILN